MGNSFNVGDTVYVRDYQIGIVIADLGNDFYSVKLKDEFENEYYETFNASELKSYY